MDNLEAAIDEAELAVSSTFEGDFDRREGLSGVGITLSVEMKISRLELAVSAVPDDHPDQAKLLS